MFVQTWCMSLRKWRNCGVVWVLLRFLNCSSEINFQCVWLFAWAQSVQTRTSNHWACLTGCLDCPIRKCFSQLGCSFKEPDIIEIKHRVWTFYAAVSLGVAAGCGLCQSERPSMDATQNTKTLPHARKTEPEPGPLCRLREWRLTVKAPFNPPMVLMPSEMIGKTIYVRRSEEVKDFSHEHEGPVACE